MGLAQRVAAARGERPAELVLRNGRICSVITGELLDCEVAVQDGHVVALGNGYRGQVEHDLAGAVVVPGLIDGHMHLESTMLGLVEFSRAVVPHGTTCVVLDPHEFANVLGVDGIRHLLANGRGLPLDAFVMLSSCVPASAFESPRQPLEAADLLPLLDEDRVLGLAEVMDVAGVLAGAEPVLAKIAATLDRGGLVDGHAPGLGGRDLCAYAAAGIMSDHEATTAEEARERLRLGMWLMVREGSAARNLAALLPVLRELRPARALFCTDDRDPEDLLERGHIDAVVRQAIAGGLDPVDAVRCATVQPAQYFGLRDRGVVGPGHRADLCVVDGLETFAVQAVYKDGVRVAEAGRPCFPVMAAATGPPAAPDGGDDRHGHGSVRIRRMGREALRIPGRPGSASVIGVRDGDLFTSHLLEAAPVRDGELVADPGRDLLKMAVVERHHGTGRVGLGLVRGIGLCRGAIASTVAHDAHNLVVVGVDDDDLLCAIEQVVRQRGGLAVASGGSVLAAVPLPVAGLVSRQPAAAVAAQLRGLDRAVAELGCGLRRPAMTLSFLCLSVIPELKLTDRGLVDVTAGRIVPIQG
ncbi:MAG TPA: adenine deaminase [Candidatus Micrarchaeia archaeon]|nr:adenine deaminase [Candidatus Micrarchaeia archaeon]